MIIPKQERISESFFTSNSDYFWVRYTFTKTKRFLLLKIDFEVFLGQVCQGILSNGLRVFLTSLFSQLWSGSSKTGNDT